MDGFTRPAGADDARPGEVAASDPSPAPHSSRHLLEDAAAAFDRDVDRPAAAPGGLSDAVIDLAVESALELAARGPAADPNPRVGAVLLDESGVVVGRGFHRGAGTPHAEVEALADAARAGVDVRRGTAVVTLEPCAHIGRTGPCAEALVAAGISRVVYLDTDPGPASGGGAARLEEAGVATEHRPDPRARALTRYWRHGIQSCRPFVTWKFAATLDGRSAAPDGTSRWITGGAARADVHVRRAGAGAVVVGTGTVLADDPGLTVRDETGAAVGRQPLRVAVGLRDLPRQARMFDEQAPSLQIRSRSPHVVLAELHELQIRHVWLEGGPRVAAAFVAAGLVDEIVAYMAPALLGSGASALGDLGARSIHDLRRYALTDVTRLGDDVRLVLTPPTAGPAPAGAPGTPPSRQETA